MQQLLQSGDQVRSQGGVVFTVGKYLGGGGQGEVYVAESEGQSFALKWYFPHTGTEEQREALELLTKRPAPSDRFLWPLEIMESDARPGFGYLMGLRGTEYKGIVDLMKRRAEPSFWALATAALELSRSFRALHLEGLCYRDISFGNAFLNPGTGEILICDNDNVTIDGNPNSTISGTPRFMAPEIVRGEAKPSSQTDLFSLAVLLFYMLMVHHPLEGRREAQIRCLDLPAMNKLYGSDPLFIFDPSDDSNAPDPQLHQNAIAFWSVYPQFLRDLFTRSFTDGLDDPEHGRVRETEWQNAMAELRDSIVYCPKCGVENFYDRAALVTSTNGGQSCWACRKPLTMPPRLRVGRNIIMLNHDTKLFPHHVDNRRRFDFSQAVAEVNQHPSNPSIWGLKNTSRDVWVRITEDGESKEVAPGSSVSIVTGTTIRFPASEGEFRTG